MEDGVRGDAGAEEDEVGDITCSEHCDKLRHPLGIGDCGKEVLLSSSPLPVESSSALFLSAFIPLSPGICAISHSFPPPPWALLKRSAANSRARTAAWDWLGDEGIGIILLGGSRFSGDPWGGTEEEDEAAEA